MYIEYIYREKEREKRREEKRREKIGKIEEREEIEKLYDNY